jgi:hypothetical protein
VDVDVDCENGFSVGCESFRRLIGALFSLVVVGPLRKAQSISGGSVIEGRERTFRFVTDL